MRYLIHIGYDGSDYSGWQFQPNAESVQGVIEEKLKAIFKVDISVVGCGRTDAGVHASQYALHFNLADALDFDLKFRLNKHLPNSIVVYDVIELNRDQHTRFDAVSRTYDYFIHLYKDPILHQYSSFYELPNLDFEAMKKAVALLPLYTDFKAVCKQPNIYKHTLCTVTHAQLFVHSNQQRLRFTITANRFLRGMVRILVSFLLKVGSGEMTLERFEEILKDQLDVPEKAPAHSNGLYLSKIEYPYLELAEQDDICRLLKENFE